MLATGPTALPFLSLLCCPDLMRVQGLGPVVFQGRPRAFWLCRSHSGVGCTLIVARVLDGIVPGILGGSRVVPITLTLTLRSSGRKAIKQPVLEV